MVCRCNTTITDIIKLLKYKLCNHVTPLLFSCSVYDCIWFVFCVFGVAVLLLCCRLGQVTLGKEVQISVSFLPRPSSRLPWLGGSKKYWWVTNRYCWECHKDDVFLYAYQSPWFHPFENATERRRWTPSKESTRALKIYK